MSPLQGREKQEQEAFMELKGTGQMGEQGEEGKQRVSFGPMLRCDLASLHAGPRSLEARAAAEQTAIQARVAGGKARRRVSFCAGAGSGRARGSSAWVETLAGWGRMRQASRLEPLLLPVLHKLS